MEVNQLNVSYVNVVSGGFEEEESEIRHYSYTVWISDEPPTMLANVTVPGQAVVMEIPLLRSVAADDDTTEFPSQEDRPLTSDDFISVIVEVRSLSTTHPSHPAYNEF